MLRMQLERTELETVQTNLKTRTSEIDFLWSFVKGELPTVYMFLSLFLCVLWYRTCVVFFECIDVRFKHAISKDSIIEDWIMVPGRLLNLLSGFIVYYNAREGVVMLRGGCRACCEMTRSGPRESSVTVCSNNVNVVRPAGARFATRHGSSNAVPTAQTGTELSELHDKTVYTTLEAVKIVPQSTGTGSAARAAQRCSIAVRASGGN